MIDNSFELNWLKDFHPTWKVGDIYKKLNYPIKRLYEMHLHSMRYNLDSERKERLKNGR